MIMTIGSVVVPALLAGFESFSAGISAVMSAIQGIFQGLITFITGVFSGSWSQAWEGIKQIFGSAFDGLVALCKAPLNAVIAIINKAISGINGLGLTIPKWVPILGGKSFSVNIPTLPMLARGGFAGRYGLGFTYDADDYDIECDEQDGTDSSYYNTICKNYGLILKVYAKRLWVYDRERYKGKRAVQDFDRTNIIPGSLSYNTTLSGTYTGGYFTYTDADKDLDIVCSVGGGNHTKNVNRRATSVFDASVQLCAEINNANHGRVKLKFSVMGNWGVSAGNNLRLTGYGDGLNGGINGKYFVDKVTHKYTKSGGFVTSFECSGIFDPFHYWDVGGHIEYHQSEDSSSESYNSAYETTSPAANAASAAAGATAGAAVTLTKAPFYYTSVAPKPSCYKSGTFYFYDGILVNNRYRITNTAARCGKLPVGKNVTGWVPASYCNGGGITTK